MLEKFSHGIQILSGVVLIVGVVLVLLQMEQTERLTRAQLSSEFFDAQIAQAASAAGQEPMTSFAKLCDPGAQISLKDSLVLHNLFLQRFYIGLKGYAVQEEGGFDTEDIAMRVFIGSLGLVIVTPQGRSWLESVPMSQEQREALKSSPYYESTCDDLGPVTTLIRADRSEKAGDR